MAQLLKLPRPALADPAVTQLIDTLERGDPWREMTYNEITSDVAISATTEGGATTIVTADSLDTDGKPILIEFFAAKVTTGTNNLTLVLYDDPNGAGAGSIGKLAERTTAGTEMGILAKRRLVPSVGRHVYSVRGYKDAGLGGSVTAGAGGSGNFVPAFIRIMRA